MGGSVNGLGERRAIQQMTSVERHHQAHARRCVRYAVHISTHLSSRADTSIERCADMGASLSTLLKTGALHSAGSVPCDLFRGEHSRLLGAKSDHWNVWEGEAASWMT